MKKILKWIAAIFIGFYILGTISEKNKSPEQKAAESLVKEQEAASKKQEQEEQNKKEVATLPNATNANFEYTTGSIKNLSKHITDVQLFPQYDNPNSYQIDIDFDKEIFTSGAQDWNSISADAHNLSKTLLEKPSTKRIHITFRSPNNNNLDWARIFVDRKKLPTDWQKLTYLEFFSYTEPVPGTLETRAWLCDFYQRYHSAQPNGMRPKFCSE